MDGSVEIVGPLILSDVTPLGLGFAAAEKTQAVESLARQLLQSRFQCRVAGEFFSQLGA